MSLGLASVKGMFYSVKNKKTSGFVQTGEMIAEAVVKVVNDMIGTGPVPRPIDRNGLGSGANSQCRAHGLPLLHQRVHTAPQNACSRPAAPSTQCKGGRRT